jgi:tight adherence protein B
MQQNTWLMVAAGLAFLAGVVGVLALAGVLELHFGKRARALERQIGRVLERPATAMAAELARSIELRLPAMLQRARQTPLLRGLELLLLRSGSSRHLVELLGLLALLALAGLIAGLLLQAGWPGVLLAVGCAVGAPLAWLYLRAARRRARFEAQLPEALDFIARALRAGHGLMAGLGMVASELSDPVAAEFGTVFEEVNFGVPLGEALSRMAARVDSRDLDFFVVAVSIQRETGGNLAELLGGLAGTVRERMKLAGKVRALSSEGRLSAVLMTALPFVLGAILNVINPEYMSLLWTTPEGRQTVAVMLVMMLVGSIWIQMLVRIRV